MGAETARANAKMEVKGTTLTITIDLTKRFGESASGKSISIATTGGNVQPQGAPDGVFVGLNVYAKK